MLGGKGKEESDYACCCCSMFQMGLDYIENHYRKSIPLVFNVNQQHFLIDESIYCMFFFGRDGRKNVEVYLLVN